MNAERLVNMFGLLTVIDYMTLGQHGMEWIMYNEATHLQHLRGYDDRLAGHVAFGNHHLLS